MVNRCITIIYKSYLGATAFSDSPRNILRSLGKSHVVAAFQLDLVEKHQRYYGAENKGDKPLLAAGRHHSKDLSSGGHKAVEKDTRRQSSAFRNNFFLFYK